MRKYLTIYFLLAGLISFAQTKTLYEEVSLLYKEEKFEDCLKMEAALIGWATGRTDTLVANVYGFLADSHLKSGTVEKAISFFESEKSIRQAQLPEGVDHYSTVLYYLSSAYLQANDIQHAKETAQLSIDFDQKTYGVNSEQYASSLFNYIDILSTAGQVTEAEIKLEQIRKDAPDFSRENGELLSKLADIYSYGGKYNKSERVFHDALELLRISDGEDSEAYNVALSNYATLLMHQGKYDKAEEILTQVLDVSKDKGWFGENNYYATLNNLAIVYQKLGQYKASEGAFKTLMRVDSATIGTNHPDYSITLSNLGLLYIDEEKYDQAERVLKKSIDILKKNKETQSISYAKKLNNLAKAYQRSGKSNEAVSLLQQSMKIFEKHFGKESPEYANASFILGVAYLNLKSPKALPALKTALDIRSKIVGKSHPSYAECEERIAQYYWMKKNRAESGKLYNSVFDNYFGQIDTYFPVLTEEEKSNFFYQKIKPSFESFATFSVEDAKDSKLLGQLYDYQLNTKGLILAASEKVRSSIITSGDTALIALYEKWENAKDVLTYYYSTHESQKNIDSLTMLSNQLEKTLVKNSETFAKNAVRQKVNWKAIQEKLKPGEAALECIRYRIFNADSSRFTSEIGYAFLFLTSETVDGPKLISFANGGDMEARYLNYYRNGIRLKIDDLYTYKNYWEPVQDQLSKFNIKKIIFSPDGVYNIININSIKDPFTNKYLLDEIDFRIVTSTRTILEGNNNAKKNKGTGYLFGYPNYNINTPGSIQKQQRSGGNSSRSFRGGMLRFLRDGKGITLLPGTKVEVEQIAKNIQPHFDSISLSMEAKAVESKIKKLNNPSLLHIATHGYFLDDDESNVSAASVPNPLMLSGLILAGAENFIRTGNNPLHETDDGILTAYEAMNLDLGETKLVVLSACETGLGKIYPGEGVYGLQRAFQVAGAEAVIMSLWTVDDTATQLLMKLFYEQYIQTDNLYQSFRYAQQKLKEKYPEPFYWGAFILVGKGE
jgi:CHAT domain-containing protein/Tfp pilus assembly protein PilF